MRRLLRILFLVEGFTDIRFIVGLSEICALTMVVPARQYAESGLKDRVVRSGAAVRVCEIPGGRITFQIRSFFFLWQQATNFDVILSQEVLRGSINATIVGSWKGIPAVTYMGISPIEYFRCRRERGQIGWAKALAGETLIWALMAVNGRLATRTLAMGPYLRDVASHYCPRTQVGLYYGVDTEVFHPVNTSERATLRRRLNLPTDKFLIVLSSRMSHEKDPETVLYAVSFARLQGLDAVVINLGGGYKQFLHLAKDLRLPDSDSWVLGRPAVHPTDELADYFRAADVVALASLAEGAAFSTLEALACGTPVAATAVGGIEAQVKGYARLTPRRDPKAMAVQFLWISANPSQARSQALEGRMYVVREWSRQKAFGDLREVLEAVSLENRLRGSKCQHPPDGVC